MVAASASNLEPYSELISTTPEKAEVVLGFDRLDQGQIVIKDYFELARRQKKESSLQRLK